MRSEGLNFFGVGLTIDSDDPQFVAEFESLFGAGGVGPSLPSHCALGVTLRNAEGTPCAWFAGDDLADPAAFLAGFSSTDIPLRLVDGAGVSVGSDPEPVFRFEGSVCRIRPVAGWRRMLAHFIFLRIVNLRPDLLFFHAAAVAIHHRAYLLIGPKGRGKTSVSVALIARGHAFFGDETAVVDPATGYVHPFHRPVGIKPGPRSAHVDSVLGQIGFPSEGILRVPVARLVEGPEPPPMRLGGIVFLQGFSQETTLEEVQAGPEELSQMQPIASSLHRGMTGRRVMAMIRLLGETRCYKLWPSDPDSTARELERVLAHDADRE